MKKLWRRTWQGIRHTPGLFVAASSSLALALFLTAGLWLAGVNFSTWGEKLLGANTIVVYLTPSADGLIAEQLASNFVGDASVHAISPEQAAQELATLSATSASSGLFGWSLELISNQPDGLDRLQPLLRYYRDVEDVDDGSVVLGRVAALQRLLTAVGWALAVLLVGACIFVVNVTMSLALVVRRDEIQIQKIVGASDLFVLLPLLCEALLEGALAVAVALPLLKIATWLLAVRWQANLALLSLTPPVFLPSSAVTLLAALSLVIAFVGTLIASLRHLGTTE